MDANPSPQGVITEFYERKRVEPGTWQQTNGDTVVLCSLGADDRLVAGGDTFRCRFFASDFSHPPLTHPRLEWQLCAEEETLATGTIDPAYRPFCTCPVGEAQASLPTCNRPRSLNLEARLVEGERVVENRWRLWLFPADTVLPDATGVYGNPAHTWLRTWRELPRADTACDAMPVILSEMLDDKLIAFAEKGGAIILAAGEGLVRPHSPNFGYVRYFFTPPANYAPYEDGQNGTVILEHPMLGDFPHEGFADLQWFRMVDGAPPLDLEPLGLNDADPVIRVIHRYPVCRPLGYLAERRLGKGSLILCALYLDPTWPEARLLLSRLCNYAAAPNHDDCPPVSSDTISTLRRVPFSY